jgi:hypothetical protein
MRTGQSYRGRSKDYNTITVKMEESIIESVNNKVMQTPEKNASKYIEETCTPLLKKFKGEVPRRKYGTNPLKKTFMFSDSFTNLLKEKSGRSMGVLLEELLKKAL